MRVMAAGSDAVKPSGKSSGNTPTHCIRQEKSLMLLI